MCFFSCFFFNDPATTEIYTLSLHDALPISELQVKAFDLDYSWPLHSALSDVIHGRRPAADLRVEWEKEVKERSEEHTSELQSQFHLVCRLLLEKKKKKKKNKHT